METVIKKDDVMAGWVYFQKDFLMNELGLSYDNTIEEHIVDLDRWSAIYEIIFEYNGNFYRTRYAKGATELQDEQPWEYVDEILCEEVEQKQVTKMEWVLKGE